MTGVTEFALIKLKPGYDKLELYELLMCLLEDQDGWVREHKPHLLNGRNDVNLTKAYIATTDPPYLLLVAPWDSPECHREWIASKENQEGFAKLQEFIAAGDDSVVLFHMTPAGKQSCPPPTFIEHSSFDVDRIFTKPGSEKETVDARYQMLEKTLLDLKLGDHFWGGWRIEKTESGADELVVFSSHTYFPLQHTADRLNISHSKESRRFQHVDAAL
jgi:hypothetical protein